MKLISQIDPGIHPSTGVEIPEKGKGFEADADKAAELIAAGLAVEAKGKKEGK